MARSISLRKLSRYEFVACVVLVALIAADTLSTQVVLNLTGDGGSTAREAMLVARLLIGLGLLWGAKLLVAVVVVVLVKLQPNGVAWWLWFVFWGVTALYFVAILINTANAVQLLQSPA